MKLSINLRLNLFLVLYSFLILTTSCSKNKDDIKEQNLTPYVDPYIGTGAHGHVFMGANVPFGLVQLGPSNISEGWDWCSGYHLSDSTIFGFSHMHLSGIGTGDLGDINLMPVIGEVNLNKGKPGDYSSGMYSLFDRKTEKVKPGYYAVHLERYGVNVELTATKRVGFHKYTFPKSADARVIIDLFHGLSWDKSVDCHIFQEDNKTISGYRYSTGWANDQRVFFTINFSKPIKGFILHDGENPIEGKELKGERVFGQVLFDTEDNEDIFIKVALSPTSIENAKANMLSELAEWDFEKTITNADKAWNDELNKIHIKTDDQSIKRIFYTSLYHSMIAPSEFCDVNGDYYGADHQMHKGEGFINYTTFSLWDTYRAAHPLMTIIHPEKMSDIINTMLTINKQQGKLPVWHLVGCETDAMVGNPGVPVVADAILKGYTGFDKEYAYEAMKNSMMMDERGLKYYKEMGYIPYEVEREGLSRAMEYAIADWSLAQVAKTLNKEEDYQYFMNRSKVYKHYFDKETGFVRGKDIKGNFRPNFNPFTSIHGKSDYTEGNAWQYTWLVPHDIHGLAAEFGGKDKLINKLDSLFLAQGDLGEQASLDITGLIGQYAHGNEPSHHILYLYQLLGQPWKTAEKVRETLYTLYDDSPEGICGNEDVGQMSAWYILSAMGMYQVEPAGGKYYFGSPILDEAILKVRDGYFKIITHNNSKKNIYIQGVKLNGKAYTENYLNFEDIAKGGTLEFEMGSTPSTTWAIP